MKKKHLQLVLDIILCIGILSLYNKRLFGILYHEVAGVVLILTMAVHILINIKTVRGMTRSFKKVPFEIKLCLIVDILLTLAFIWEGVNGILISKKILTSISSKNMLFKQQHYFTAAVSVILLGVHIGLHISRKKLPMWIATAVTAVSLVCAGFAVTGSNMTRWLSMPFSQMDEHREMPGGDVPGEQPERATDADTDGTLNDADTEAAPKDTAQTAGDTGTESAAKDEQAGRKGPGERSEGGPGERREGGPGGEGPGGHGGEGGSESFLSRMWSVLQYAGVTFTFAMATYWAVRLKKRKTCV